MGCGSCSDMKVALADEENAVQNYGQAAERAKLPELKAMFEMLKLHEEGHTKLLKSMLEKFSE